MSELAFLRKSTDPSVENSTDTTQWFSDLTTQWTHLESKNKTKKKRLMPGYHPKESD